MKSLLLVLILLLASCNNERTLQEIRIDREIEKELLIERIASETTNKIITKLLDEGYIGLNNKAHVPLSEYIAETERLRQRIASLENSKRSGDYTIRNKNGIGGVVIRVTTDTIAFLK